MAQQASFSPKLLIPLAAVFLGVALLMSSFVIVEPGHVGVVKKLGEVQAEALPEGLSFKVPFIDVIEQVNVRLTSKESQANSASKDLQTVRTKVTLQFSVQAAFAPKIFQKIGRRDVVGISIVDPAISESVKSVTARYTAEELVTKRAEVKGAIQDAIETFIGKTLKNKEIEAGISIANVAITDFDFSDEFNRAIEQKVKAEQEALKALQEKVMRVTQAEAANEEKKLQADAAAYQIEVESKARADAIRREAEALKRSPELIQLRIAEKWDGVLPRVTGSEAIPLLNFDTK